jgi:hypothetical protein
VVPIRSTSLVTFAGSTLFGILAAGCQPAIPAYTVNVPPRLVDLRPPRSVAVVHGDVSLDGARAEIEKAIPHDVTGDKKIDLLIVHGVDVTWHLVRHPVALKAEKDGLSLEVALLGEVGAHGDGIQCSGRDAGVVFHVDAAPTLLPNGDVALDHLAWKPDLRGKLDCGSVQIPLGDILGAVAQPLANALAKGVEQIHVPAGAQLQSALSALKTPQTLHLGDGANGDVGGDACLDMDPAQFVLSPVGGAGSEMNLRVGVDVAPRVSLGACGPASTPTPHPGPLVRVQPLKDQFDVALDVAIPYDDLQQRVAPDLVGHTFGSGDHTVTVEGFEAGDASGHVLARMPIRGALTGMMYLWGTPAITQNGDRWQLSVPDLHVAVESESFATKLALVVLEFQNGGLEKMMRDKLQLDVTDKVKKVQGALSGTRVVSSGPPVVSLTTTATKIEPGQVASQPGALVAQPIVSGRAEIGLK